MARFMVLYHAPASAIEQMGNLTPEQQKAGMDLWMGWSEKNKDAIVDLGSPLAGSRRVRSDSVADDKDSTVSGFSVLEADSPEAVAEILKGHPHFHTPGDVSIEVLEYLAIPGM
jgi:hypothetical protein